MSTTNTNGVWMKTWDRSGRVVQVYDSTATKPATATQRPDFTDNKPKKT